MNERIVHLDVGFTETKWRAGGVTKGTALGCGGVAEAGLGIGLTQRYSLVTCGACRRSIQEKID